MGEGERRKRWWWKKTREGDGKRGRERRASRPFSSLASGISQVSLRFFLMTISKYSQWLRELDWETSHGHPNEPPAMPTRKDTKGQEFLLPEAWGKRDQPQLAGDNILLSLWARPFPASRQPGSIAPSLSWGELLRGPPAFRQVFKWVNVLF